METRAYTHPRRPRPALALLALLLALIVVSACLAGGATARAEHAHRSSCAANRHGKSAKRCPKHHARKGAHKPKKAVSKPAAPAPKLTPALCEDGSAPARAASGAYTCEDESEPACEDGSDPLRPSASSAPMCRLPGTGSGLGCGPGANAECGLELACEEEATEGPQGCEHGSAFEEEELEA